VSGVGLEPLEGCEIFFSESNALAPSIRHASVFHRQQTIVNYLRQKDVETYASLCTSFLLHYLTHTKRFVAAILVKKYKHALEVQATAPALEEAMRQLGIASKEEFVQWRAAEKAALEGLLHEPPVETMSMEYYQKLVNLAELKYVSHSISIFCANCLQAAA
jgi:hypothetical protein